MRKHTTMKKSFAHFLLLVGLAFSYSGLMAQNRINISGTVGDSTSAPLIGATVVLLQSADSVLASFAMTDNAGNFELKRISPGKYILQTSYIGFIKKSQNITIQPDQGDIRLSRIVLNTANTTLEQVDIEGVRTPITMKKDTIEYTADAFEVRPNATVEDLLKKMPGIEVEQDGTIKAQGEEVQRVLVDGKEFFGTDPKLATKNLPAEVVDKVQVFDRKSEMADFTGIDDGQEQKTINLSLKQDKKKGTFGKVEGGYGSEDRYEFSGNMNRFNNKTQLSLIGQLNNTNKQGFSFDDYISFMGGMSALRRGRGGFNTGGANIANGPSYGFRTTAASGLNFNHEFSKKTKLNISYFYNYYKNEQDRIALRENFLTNRTFFSEDSTSELSTTDNHRINLYFEHKMDSSQEMSIRSSLGFNEASSNSEQLIENLSVEGVTESRNASEYESEGERVNFDTELNYRKKFAKRGRSLATTFTVGGTNNNMLAGLVSLNAFPQRMQTDSLNQSQDQADDQINYGIDLTYTEPVGRRSFLSATYRHQNNRNNLDKEFYDLDPTDLTPVLNQLLTNKYQRDFLYHRGGLSYRMVFENVNFNFGGELQHTTLDGEWLNRDTMINRQNTQFLPNFRATWDLATTRNIRFDYRTSVQEPSMDQIQPIVDNSNPLNVYVGNPELSPEYQHRASMRFFSFSQFSQTSIFANLSATYTTDKIANTRTIDSLFRQVTTPVNVDNDLRLSLYGSLSFPMKAIGSRIRLNGNVSYNRGILFVNEIENNTDRISTTTGIQINNTNTKKVDLSVGADFTYSTTAYSVSSDLNQSFLNQTYFADLTVYVTEKLNLSTTLDYAVFSNEAFADQQAIPIWRASLSHYVLKNNRGEIKFEVNDILNRNLGISRTNDLNYIEEERITSLARYFMVKFVYNLSKFPGAGGPSGRGGGMWFGPRRR